MKQASLLIVIFVLLLIGVTFYVANPRTPEPQPMPAATQTPATNQTPRQSSTATTGRYVPYSSSVIGETDGTKILFFHAPWCPQCRALEASIEATAIPAMVTIIKVDYDTNQSLRQQYGVTLQTTLVRVDDQGKLIKKLVAYDEPNFSSIEQLLN